VSYLSGVYTYDGNDLRIQKTVGATNTVYVFSGSKVIAEYDNGAAVASPSREYIYSGGQLVATLSSTTTTYHHADHLSVRLSTDASGNKIGEQGHYPYGEAWYTSNQTTKFIFTTYQRDSESDNDYALARFYINRFGRFSCVDPVEGDAEDPQSWNRYAYARNDPINITDPSGKGWFSWLLHALLGILDIATGGSSAPLHGFVAAGHGASKALKVFTLLLNAGVAAADVVKLTQGSKGTQSQAPPGYTPCPPRWFLITGIRPGQATGQGATGTPPSTGDVAYNPKNFGLTDRQGRRIADSDNPIIFKPDWSKAQITGKHGRGTVAPAPDKGMPQIPDGLPVGTDDTLPGTDIIGGRGVNRAANQNRIDLYRYPTDRQADAATRRVPVIVYLPKGSGAKCPK
jgi:RHS repeat-associated protein